MLLKGTIKQSNGVHKDDMNAAKTSFFCIMQS